MDISKETARGFAALRERNYPEAAAVARALASAGPDDPGALTLLGRLALFLQDADVAFSIFERLVSLPRAPSATWLDLSHALVQLRRDREAAEAAQRAVETDPRDARAWLRLGEISLSLNDRAAAAHALHRAIALDAACVRAYRGLARATEENSRGLLAEQIERLLARPELPNGDRAELYYALAELHRSTNPKAFIRHVLAANAAQKSAAPANGRPQYEEMFDRLEAAFTPQAFSRAQMADPSAPAPIFILGMPRSGTTLVERIVSADPAVAAGGELDYVRGPLTYALQTLTGRPFPQGFADLTTAQLNSLARGFSLRLTLVARGAPFATDKTPGNYHAAGLLLILFPACRIVHVKRCPMDACLSILAQPFDARSLHTYDMDLLAYAYGRYERLMRLWEDLFGERIATLEYERLIEDPEAEGARLFADCGLEWNAHYLRVEAGGDAVRTLSAQQARRPLYKTSIGGWRRYADELAPLYAALERELGRVPVSGGA